MYTLKPVVALPEEISLPNTMYKLPRIQGGSITSSDDNPVISNDLGRQMPHPEYNALEFKQMKILKELCELKEQVEFLCITARLSDVNKPHEKIGTNGTIPLFDQNPVNAEVIIYANPERPPYCILALQRIWKDVRFHIETHRHSTVPDAITQQFEGKLLANTNNSAVHNIDVRLIWKDVNDIQLVTKVYDYPLEGEANILRYLTRLINNHDYENSRNVVESNLIDNILDLCLQLSYEEPRGINAVTAKFASHLGGSKWLLNSANPTIVDVATWSIIKRVAHNRIPKDLKLWYTSCEETFLSS